MTNKNKNFNCKFFVGEVKGEGWVAVTPHDEDLSVYFRFIEDTEEEVLATVARGIEFFLESSKKESARISLYKQIPDRAKTFFRKRNFAPPANTQFGENESFVPKETFLAQAVYA